MTDNDRSATALPLRDRLLEVMAVLILGITTLGTAWCGYQASRWSDNSSDLAQMSSDQHVEAARLFGVATQQIGYDNMMVAQYAEAQANNEPELLAFYKQTLIRRQFLPVLARWEAEARAGRTPSRVLDDPAYLAQELAPYNAAVASAEASAQAGQRAGSNADAYVATTILLAAALFFAGVTSSFRYRAAQVFLLVAALITLGVAASKLAGLPVS